MPKINNPRLLLAKIRQGDFAHAGDIDAINIVLKKIFDLNKISTGNSKKALDVGCGLGGTASYIKDKTSLEVCGIDIDTVAIKHCKEKYPSIQFFEKDIYFLDEIFSENTFDYLFLFNVFYTLSNQKRKFNKIS